MHHSSTNVPRLRQQRKRDIGNRALIELACNQGDQNGMEDFLVIAHSGSAGSVDVTFSAVDSTTGVTTMTLDGGSGDLAVKQIVPVADINDDGKVDFLVSYQFGGSPLLLRVNSPSGGVTPFPTPSGVTVATIIDITSIPDSNGDGTRDVAILVENSSGSYLTTIYDFSNGDIINSIPLASWIEPLRMFGANDWSGNNASEVIVYGTLTSGEAVLSSYDSADGTLLRHKFYPAWFRASEVHYGGNISGIHESSIVMLGSTTGGANIWVAMSPTGVWRIGGYPGWFTPDSIEIVPDDNGDGSPDIITLGMTNAGNWVWQRNDMLNGSMTRRQGYPGWFTPESLQSIRDTNDNGEEDLATFGTSSSGKELWLKHDAALGNSLGSVQMPAGLN